MKKIMVKYWVTNIILFIGFLFFASMLFYGASDMPDTQAYGFIITLLYSALGLLYYNLLLTNARDKDWSIKCYLENLTKENTYTEKV
jgi:hypothetical protein